MNRSRTIYQQVLGDDYVRLPEELRRFHALQGELTLQGTVTILGASTWPGKLTAWMMRLPPAAPPQPFRFSLQADSRSESWTRRFPTRTMRSTLRARGRRLTESFGPIRLWFVLRVQDGALSMALQRFTVLGLPLPLAWVPRIHAVEHGDKGRMQFAIDASWPGSHRIVAYRGTLALPPHKDQQ